jgi:hypothetical protein
MKYLTMLLAIGVVDQIQGDMVVAEITKGDEYNETIEFNLLLFPCEIQEGGMFYIIQAGGVTEIRCGEPDPA